MDAYEAHLKGRATDPLKRLTTAYEAYLKGREDRRNHPDAKSWNGILPFSVTPLSHSWLDGWYDEAGDYGWRPGGSGKPIAVPWGVEGGRCKFCSNYPMIYNIYGALVCSLHTCRERHYDQI